MKNSSKVTIFCILSFMLVSCSNTGGLSVAEYGFLAPKHSLQPNGQYKVLWTITNISITELSSLPSIVGAPQKIIIHGMEMDSLPQVQVFTLDSLSGNIIWKLDGQDWGYIITQNNIVYRGTGGTATVQAFNIENAGFLWSTRLPGAHSTSDMHFSENKLFINTNDDEVFILDEQGEILDHIRSGDRVFLDANGVRYKEGNLSIKAVDLSTNNEFWSVDIGEPYDYSPVFDNGTIFVRTYSIPSKIYSIDQTSGKLIWDSSQDVLSNLCILMEIYISQLLMDTLYP